MVSDPKKDSASEKPDRSDQDLRVLLLMLLLTVLVFALFLLRSNRPGDFEHARLAVVAGAEDAYSQAREDAPSWISRIADFATYVRDYGNAPVPPPIPKYVPKESLPVEPVPPVSVVADFSGTLVPPVSTGASAGSSDIGTVPVTDSWSALRIPEPIIIEYGKYVFEIEGPITKGEDVSISLGKAKLTVRARE